MNHKLIIGTVQFGLNYGINNQTGQPSEQEVFDILNEAAAQGISILDTADAYGNATEILGRYNREFPGKFQVNTKFRKGEKPVAEQLNRSLEKLNMESVNGYFYHSYADFISYPELVDELLALKDQGLISMTGLSVYNNAELEQAVGHPGIDMIQLPFNLLDNFTYRGALITEGKKNGKNIQVRSAFLQGLFFMDPDHSKPAVQALRSELLQLRSLSGQFGLTTEEMALGYCLQQEEIDNVLIGVDSLHQLNLNLKAAQTRLPEELVHAIDGIKVADPDLLNASLWKN